MPLDLSLKREDDWSPEARAAAAKARNGGASSGDDRKAKARRQAQTAYDLARKRGESESSAYHKAHLVHQNIMGEADAVGQPAWVREIYGEPDSVSPNPGDPDLQALGDAVRALKDGCDLLGKRMDAMEREDAAH